MRTCRLRFRTLRERAALLRRLNECACNRLVYCRSCGGLPVQPADHSLTSDPSYQAPPLRTFAARHRSCTADCSIPVFRYRFGPSRPGPAMSPSLCSPGNAPGVHQRPSQACSRIGWATISDRPGPLACLSDRSPRFVFVGYSGFLDRKRSCRRLDWLLGFDSRLRSVSRSDCEARREIVPALGFASCRVCGHFLTCIRTGSTPFRIIKPQGS